MPWQWIHTYDGTKQASAPTAVANKVILHIEKHAMSILCYCDVTGSFTQDFHPESTMTKAKFDV